jgi:hypothetical protein
MRITPFQPLRSGMQQSFRCRRWLPAKANFRSSFDTIDETSP